jgi:hypothetical protein
MKIKALFFNTSTDVITVSKECTKPMLHSIICVRLRKNNEVISIGRNVMDKLQLYFRCNGSAIVTIYCYLGCNENVTIYYKKYRTDA